jgi:signal peptidase I
VNHPRSALLTTALLVSVALAWLFIAPAAIGGSNAYVTTHGVSMEPRFHTGDVAVVRPADDYRVGQVVAYRSSLLRTVVLHRIIARDGDRYVLRGDNNDFIDPEHPRRDAVIGSLRLRVPHGGRVLDWLHTPVFAGLLVAGVVLLLFGSKRRRRRRDRRRPAATRTRPSRDRTMTGQSHHTFLIASAVVAAAFFALGLAAFTRPTTERVPVKTAYTERVSFDYSAPVGPAAEAVYPKGVVETGDPVFLNLVPRIRLKLDYRVETGAAHLLGGTSDVVARVSNSSGWSRTILLAPRTRFTGDRAGAEVTLDVAALRTLIARVEKLTGSMGGAYSVAVIPRVHLDGMVAGQPAKSDYRPALNFQLDGVALRPASAKDFKSSRPGSVTVSSSAPNTLSLRGHELAVATARPIALIGFLLASVGALVAWRLSRRGLADPSGHIHARHRHLIVPIAGMTINPARPPIDVTSIEALAQLAERSERLILHHRGDAADSYLVDDEGTLYRYVARRPERHLSAAPEVPAGAVGR